MLNSVNPDKDVDGFHPVNVGRLSIGERALVPCTPVGSVILAKTVQKDLTGVDAVVIGRSNIVGKPVAQLLLKENCTVTIAHSKTRNLPSVVKRADLVIAAVGIPELVARRLAEARRHRHRRRHQSHRRRRRQRQAGRRLPL